MATCWSTGLSVYRSSSSQVQTDLAILGELVDDLRLELCVVDARLPEGSSIAILLPVVMPVPLLVGTVTKHGHLDTDRKLTTS